MTLLEGLPNFVMSREIEKDFKSLQAFISIYNLNSVSDLPEFNSLLKKLHQKYLALLVFQSEIESLRKGNYNEDELPSSKQIVFLFESLSDLGQSIFCWTHGAYKASRVMLRSSIENLVKGLACDQFPDILTEKSLYAVFDIAKQTDFFLSKNGVNIFSELRSKYSDLCKDVHTATTANLSGVSAMNYFPTFKEEKAKESADILILVMKQIISVFCLSYNSAFHSMHHSNRGILFKNIPGKYRKSVQNI